MFYETTMQTLDLFKHILLPFLSQTLLYKHI